MHIFEEVKKLLDKELKLINNNFVKFESAILKHNQFLMKHISEYECWPLLDQLEDYMKAPFHTTRKILKNPQKPISKVGVSKSILQLIEIEFQIMAERDVIKSLKNDNDLIFSYDSILKRSLMRTRKMITVLTHFV